jgi:hypothetical protein
VLLLTGHANKGCSRSQGHSRVSRPLILVVRPEPLGLAMDIFAFADRVNEAAPSYKVGGLQLFRSNVHHKRARTKKLFSPQTIFKTDWGGFAFHDGGRTELQYNLGYYLEDRVCRYGVAFSFERTQALPDPEALWPKVSRFNKWVKKGGKALKGFTMWHWDPDTQARSSDHPPREIAANLVEASAFVFLGEEVAESKLRIGRVLKSFDALYPLYQYVESGKPA